MDMSSFFPADGMGNALSSQLAPHISFRAGILNRDPTTNRVTADPRKGTLQIATSPEDGLMHLQWRPRNNSTAEQDLILFHGETEMKQVISCPASARVYVLKWKEQADARMFFWMQGVDPTQDPANIAAANSILEHGPEHQQSPSIASPALPSTTPARVNETTKRDADINMDTPPSNPAQPQQQLRNAITLDQLRAAMPRREAAAAHRELILTTPSLVDLFNTAQLHTLLANPRVHALLPRLFEHVPEQDRSIDGLNQVLRSPPFRSQVASLSHALQTGGASDILRTFGLPMDDTFSPYGLKAFLEALVKYQKDSEKEQ